VVEPVVRSADAAEPVVAVREVPAPAPQPPTLEVPPTERILRTLAAVRNWTAATPAPGEFAAAPRPPAQAADAAVAERDAAPSLEVIQKPLVRAAGSGPMSRQPDAEQRARPLGALEEAEVVNLSVSIGAIELTVEGPPPAELAPSRPTPDRAPVSPDAVARLRPYYYRPPIGW
jgi:hypothetical protein